MASESREVNPGCLMILVLGMMLGALSSISGSLLKIANKPACVAPAPPPAAGGET